MTTSSQSSSNSQSSRSWHKKTDFNILIVGGGMAGLAVAAGLAQQNLRLGLIEAQPQPPEWQPEIFSTRVSALSAASQQLLEKVGAWQPMLDLRVNPYQGMHVWDGQGGASINFSAASAGLNCLGYLVENSVTQLGLLAATAQQANLTKITGLAVESLSQPINAAGKREVKLSDGSSLSADLIIAADGANSNLRQLAGFFTREWDYGHQALVTSLKTQKPNQSTAWQIFNQQNIIALLPLSLGGDEHWSSLVWSTSPARAQELLSLKSSEFNQQLSQATEERLGKIELSQARQAITLRQRHAVNYVQPGLCLVADAAHTIHPLAGQGINLGFADVAALIQVLSQAQTKQQPLGSLRVLHKYQQLRQKDNLRMMLLMESFKRLFASEKLPLRLARNLGMNFVDQQNWLKKQLISQALGA